MSDAILRRFARDQWVRIHGTPRVTVLIGGPRARTMWLQWLRVGELEGTLLESELEAAVREAATRAVTNPTAPIAVRCTAAELGAWRAGRVDRLAAMVDEGLVEIPDDEGATPATAGRRRTSPEPGPPAHLFDARSAAEAALYEALEATPATAGRFELNGYLSVRFGSNAAEVDLISRRDRIAIEIDGFHHFSNLDAYRRDRRKDLLLQTQGLLVIRVLAQDVMQDARPAVAAVCQALACRL
jgi:very-short-patch-repair endonuclease